MKTQPPVAAEDIAWALKHGWVPLTNQRFGGTAGFEPADQPDHPFVLVIWNPFAHGNPGWVPWIAPIGAIQVDAPFGNVRAALRIAESIRRARYLAEDEMSCAEKISPLELLAAEAT